MNRRDEVRQRVRAQRRYRLLVRLYPSAHRRAFGQQMVESFGDHYRDAVQCRDGSRLRFWLAVLADTARSLLTEYTAEIRTRSRRAVRPPRRRRARAMDRVPAGEDSGTRRRTRPRRRSRYRRPARPKVRVLMRTRRHRLVYRGRLSTVAVLVVLAAAALGVGAATAHLGITALVTGPLVAVWLGYRVRLTRPVPAGPHGDGPAPPGGAGVREPLRPLPMSPAGAAARPRSEPDSPPRY